MPHREHERHRLLLATSGLVAIGVLTLLTSPAWVPDRYWTYAPEPIQELVFQVEAIEPPKIPPSPWPTLAPLSTVGPTVFPTETTRPTEILPTEMSLPTRLILPEAEHGYQGWNNCGERTLATQISYWGIEQPRDANGTIDQWVISDAINLNREDRETTSRELGDVAASYGLSNIIRYDGDIELLRKFIAADFMPIVETGYNPEPETIGWTSHFLNVRGFDMEKRELYMYDSYRDVWAVVGFDEFESYWRQFNHAYLIIFPPERYDEVAGLIGEEMNDQIMHEHALAQAEAEIALNPNDSFAWFEKGTALVGLGEYSEAVNAYEKAQALDLYNFQHGAWRMLWYQFGPYEAYFGAGRYDKVIEWADWVLLNNEYSEEAHLWWGRALLAEDKDNEDAAAYHFHQALKQHPDWREALDELAKIED